MKHSELVSIANTVIQEEGKKLDEIISTKELMSEMMAAVISELPVIAVESTIEILSKTGLITLEPDDEN